MKPPNIAAYSYPNNFLDLNLRSGEYTLQELRDLIQMLERAENAAWQLIKADSQITRQMHRED